MKIFVAIAFVLGAVTVAQAMTAEERETARIKLALECQAKEGASGEDMQALAKQETPPSRAGKCVIACFMETIGVQVDNKHVLDKAIEVTKKAHPGNDKFIEIVKTIDSDCAGVSDADRCEFAVKYSVCSIASLKKQGYQPNDVL